MKATNNANQPKKVDGEWFEPGETKEVDISEDRFSYHFTLEDDSTTSETVEVEDEKEDEEEVSKSEEKQDNKGE